MSLPLHPSAQYVTRERCTEEGLRQVNAQMETLRRLINTLNMEIYEQQNTFNEHHARYLRKIFMQSNYHAGTSKGLPKATMDEMKNKCVTYGNRAGLETERLHGEIFRNTYIFQNYVQQRLAINMGIDHRQNYPDQHFVIYITDDLPVIEETQQPRPDPHPTKQPKHRHSRHISHDLNTNAFYSVPKLPIIHVKNIDDFMSQSHDHSKIITFDVDNEIKTFTAKLKGLYDMFQVYANTFKGYFYGSYYDSYYRGLLEPLETEMINLELFLRIDNIDSDKKERALDNIINAIIKELSKSLHWYNYPKKSVDNLLEKISVEKNRLASK
jgi:hypothetical protein